jgi:uncharacterized phage protein (TIGR01671 family)
MSDQRPKFRIWNIEEEKFFEPIYRAHEGELYDLSITPSGEIMRRTMNYAAEHESNFPDKYIVQQWTGKVDADGKEIYQGDIKRIEEEHEEGDLRYYCICTWINEWSMFAWLHEDEYRMYVTFDQGIKSLDESMFWTYTLGEMKDEGTICGNIFQNPGLIK